MYIGTNFPFSAEYSAKLSRVLEDFDPLAAFEAAELDYIELAVKRRTFDRAGLQNDVTRLHERGLQVNLHPYFEIAGFDTDYEPHDLRSTVVAVLEIAREIAQMEGRTVLMNFHAASSRDHQDRPRLMRESVAFYNWLLAMVDSLQAEVQITTEYQLPAYPKEKKLKIGDSFEELVAIQSAVSHERFHLCWDMGHSTMKHVYYGAEILPPPEFPGLVRHVHIHDVDFHDQSDHRLIGTGNTPLGTLVQTLIAVDYPGGFTMEYSADEFCTPGYADFLQRSKAALLKLAEAANAKGISYV